MKHFTHKQFKLNVLLVPGLALESLGAESSYNLNIADPIGAVQGLNPIKIGIYGSLGIATFSYFHGTNHYQGDN